MVVHTPQADELIALLTHRQLIVRTVGERLHITGTTMADVSQLAVDHGVHLLELTETSRSLEDSLLDMTRSSAEFASV